MSEFSTSQVSERLGVTIRQLQWWDERRLVKPRCSGHRRVYTDDDLRKAALISELRKRGYTMFVVRRVLMELRRVALLPGSFVLTDGRHAFVDRDEKVLFDLFKEAHRPMVLVRLP
jgi:DNA-binding transcriptional MerR regulator